MLTLFFLVVGEGSVFPVEIDEGECVGILKEEIKKEKKKLFQEYDADELTIYLAKKNGSWLPSGDPDVSQLQKKDVPVEIRETYLKQELVMDPTEDLEHYFGEGNTPSKKQIHGLVVVPASALKQYPSSTQGMFLLNNRIIFIILIMTTSIRNLFEAEIERTPSVQALPNEIIQNCSIQESDNENDLKELRYYQDMGNLIQLNCKEYCTEILNKIDEFYEKEELPLPFICVEGSSGMGKTQIAFALEGNRPYFYWHATPVTMDSQRIYKNFSSITSAFLKFIARDDVTRKPKSEVLGCKSSLYADELWSFGFLFALLESWNSSTTSNQGNKMVHFSEEVSLRVIKRRAKAVKGLIQQIQEDRKSIPFFIMDEMSPNVNIEGGMNEAAFQRNIFRACGLVVIVMGTDSKITNLVAQSRGSYNEPHLWMGLVSTFPKYQLSIDDNDGYFNHLLDEYPVIREIISNSRGRFSRHFVEKIRALSTSTTADELITFLDTALDHVNLITQQRKQFLNSDSGKYAQMMAVSYTNARKNTEERETKKRRLEVGARSMHAHFANLVDRGINDYWLIRGILKKNNQDWKVKCCFPAVEEDLLLYLSILGSKEYPTYSILTRILRSISQSDIFLLMEKSFQPTRIGMLYQMTVTNHLKIWSHMPSSLLLDEMVSKVSDLMIL